MESVSKLTRHHDQGFRQIDWLTRLVALIDHWSAVSALIALVASGLINRLQKPPEA